MDESNKLRLWDGWNAAAVSDSPEPGDSRGIPGPHNPAEFADRLYACEALDPAPDGTRPRSQTGTWEEATPGERGTPGNEGPEPYTLQWFLDIENHRHGSEGRWIPHLLEFAKHSGETLLGLGNGLGTDWLQYARNGAHVVVCSPSASQLSLIRRNFELRGLPGRFLHAPAFALPLQNSSIDVVCVSSLLDEVGDPQGVINEIYRVLKPGGKVLAVTPARYDVHYWSRFCFPWFGGRGTTDWQSDPQQFSGRGLRRLFGEFIEHRVRKRQLRRREVPLLLRWLPRPILERCMGKVLVLKAFKPLSAATAIRLAA